MSKRRFDETIGDAETNESNKKPDRSPTPSTTLSSDNQPIETCDTQADNIPLSQPSALDENHSSNEQTSNQPDESTASIDRSTNQTSNHSHTATHTDNSNNQAISSSPDRSADKSNDKMSQSDSQEEEEVSEEESSEEEQIIEPENEFDDDEEFVLGIDQLSDYTIHFVDLINSRVTLHAHRFVLISMSKYFETLILDADDKKPSKCTITDKCKQPGHRCLSWPNEWIGGVEMNADDFADFFRSMYSVFDGSGGSLKAHYKFRNRWNMVPDVCLLYRLVCLDKVKRQATYECWDYHGRLTVVTNQLNSSNWDKPPKIGSYQTKPMEANDVVYHLANYFQCDTLLSVFEANAVDVVDKLTRWGGQGCDLVWWLLVWADKYKWSKLRSCCLKAVATDTECRSRPYWKEIAISLKPATLVEAFACAVEAQNQN